MSAIKTQEQFLQDVLDLKKQRPELEIKFLVDSSHFDDDYRWMSQRIYNVKVESWFVTDDRILTDCSVILEFFEEQIAGEYPDFSDRRIEGLAEEMYNKANIKDAICVYTTDE